MSRRIRHAPKAIRARWLIRFGLGACITALHCGIAAGEGHSDPPTAATAEATTRPISADGMLSAADSVTVREFDFTGNTRFSAAELREVVKGYVGRPLTPEDLEQARTLLSQHYIEKGYINSGAVLPDQPVDTSNPAGSIIQFQIVEGRLSEVHVTFLKGNVPGGKNLLRKDYVASRLNASGKPPLDIVRLKDELELLRQDPNISSINAELRPALRRARPISMSRCARAIPFSSACSSAIAGRRASARPRSMCWPATGT